MKTLADMRSLDTQKPYAMLRKFFRGRVIFCSLVISISHADAWTVQSGVGLVETFTDNAGLTPSTSATNSWVSELTPSISIEHLGGRASVLIDYRLRSTIYANQSQLNSNQNFLNASSTFEAVENWLYIDARSSITQQNRSPFGSAQLQNTSTLDINRVETSAYQISPYIRGRFANVAIYQLRLNETEARTNDDAFPDTRTREWIGVVGNAPSSVPWGWLVSGNALEIRNRDVSNRQDNRIRASGIYAFSRQLKFSLIGGYERSDFADAESRSTGTRGIGVEWLPTDRTKLSATREKRFFGDAYNFLFTHRTPRTAWRFETTKDVVVLANTLTTISPGSAYELLYDVLATSIPDPAARVQAVRRRLQESASADNVNFSSASLTTNPFVSQNREGSVAFLGARNTITLAFRRREQRDISGAAQNQALQDTDVLQRSWSASWAHRLSAISTVTAVLSSLKTDGLSLAQPSSTQRASGIVFTTRLSPRTTASLAARRTHFDSTALTSYQENALAGTIQMRF
jgi:uncharacterized protein (PEP-CTERM system associated)